MYANQLIGKLAVRTAPASIGYEESGSMIGIVTKNINNSFTSRPILILAATESHIIYRYDPKYDRYLDPNENNVLNYKYCDDNWTSWDELMKLAEPEHIDLMKRLQE